MGLYLLILLLGLQTSEAMGDNVKDSSLSPQATPYKTMDEAAVAALRASATKSTRLEYGGCILTDGTQFFHTEPASSGSEDNFEVACLVPPSLTFVGLFHTHPGIGYAEGVSGPDLVVASQMKKTSYVGLLKGNQVVKFVPGKTPTVCTNSSSTFCGLKTRTSPGELVESQLIRATDPASENQMAALQAIQGLELATRTQEQYRSAQVNDSRAQKASNGIRSSAQTGEIDEAGAAFRSAGIQ